MRLFVAIPVPEEIQKSLGKIQHILQKEGVNGNVVPSENLHLTLAFIGDFADPDLVMDALEEVTFPSFQLDINGIGTFGSGILWAGIRETEPLQALARKVRYALSKCSIPFDRKTFSPHITLMRKADYDGPLPIIRPLDTMFTVDHFSLFRSDQGRNGMIYTELGMIDAEDSISGEDNDTEI